MNEKKNRHLLLTTLLLSAAVFYVLAGLGFRGAFAKEDYTYTEEPPIALLFRGFADGLTLGELLERPAEVPAEHVLAGGAGKEEANTLKTTDHSLDDSALPENADTSEIPFTPEAGADTGMQAEDQPSGETQTGETASGAEALSPDTDAVTVTGTPSDDSYYADALFIGDSRTVGLSQYVPALDAEATFYCKTSLTIFNVLSSQVTVQEKTMTMEEALEQERFGKIYIMLGINEIGFDTESFVNAYRDVLARIRQLQPDAVIYVQSIMHVSAEKERAQPMFSNALVNERNARLMELANDADIIYLDINPLFDDETGALNAADTFDGVHLTAGAYERWYAGIKDSTR